MTNQERAADLIYSHMSSWDDEVQATKAAQALADAGLLLPDLPEPDEEAWVIVGNVISLDGMHILPMIENDALTPNEARDIAYALLAAANHAEKAETND